MTPLIIMVGAQKGGVAKTTVTRAVHDYLTRGLTPRVVQVYDTEFPGGDLKRFIPQAGIVDIERVEDQMRIFDRLAGTTLVDVRGGLLRATLAALEQAKLLDDVRAGAINLALLHVLGPTVSSLDEVDGMAGGGVRHFLVKSYINESEFFEWDRDNRYVEMFRKFEQVTISVPHLREVACEKVQMLGCGFEAFVADVQQSRILRGYVRSWLDAVYLSLDRVGLGALSDESQELPRPGFTKPPERSLP